MRYVTLGLVLVGLLFALGTPPLRAERPAPIRLYIDADFSNTRAVADAISLGVRAALHQHGNRLAGQTVEVVPRDHHGSPKRSLATMRAFQSDPQALAVFGGMQSPPYLTYGRDINAMGIPLLVTWAAAAPITRLGEGPENFIFRLSTDDSKAGPYLVEQALLRGCTRPAVLLVDTGWGRANQNTILKSLAAGGVNPSFVELFTPQIGRPEAKSLAYSVRDSGADCVIAVVTSFAAEKVLPALSAYAGETRVISHWGILNSDFQHVITHEMREALRLSVLQTCALWRERQGSAELVQALAAAAQLGVEVEGLSALPVAAGFVHAYDMTQILISAAKQASQTQAWMQGAQGRRQALKAALEDLGEPVPGILRMYQRPFAPAHSADPDAHEALDVGDLCLATFDARGWLRLADPQG